MIANNTWYAFEIMLALFRLLSLKLQIKLQKEAYKYNTFRKDNRDILDKSLCYICY